MWIFPPLMIPGLITTRVSVPAITPAPSAPRMRGFGHRREPLADPHVEMVERRRPQLDEHLVVARHRIRHVLVPENVRAPVLVDADRLHVGTILA